MLFILRLHSYRIVGLFDLYVCTIESEQSFVLFKYFPSRNRKDDFEQRRQSEAALIH